MRARRSSGRWVDLGSCALLAACSLTLLLCGFPGPARAYQLPDTGQDTCYATTGASWAVIPCAGTGEDGAYNINPMSFTDNGNGTVKDNVTGLLWQKVDDGQPHSWSEAAVVCSALTLGGTGGWRVPSKKELLSIVDFQIPAPGPVADTTFFPFPGATAFKYWSATPVAGTGTSFAWYLDFGSGGVDYQATSFTNYVRCVWGPESQAQNLVDNTDGTVTDGRTGLVWQQADPGVGTWGAALGYCEGLDLGGTTDWRLPNIKELESLVDDTRSAPAIDATVFPTALPAPYWSSTNNTYNAGTAWGVNFTNGGVAGSFSHIASTYQFNVRCVRSGSIPPLPVWRTGERNFGGGWRSLGWLGFYNMTYDPWVYHAGHGFLYPFDEPGGGVYFWDAGMQQFWWTRFDAYPYLYRFGPGAGWLWYLNNTANPRVFYNWSTGAYEEIP